MIVVLSANIALSLLAVFCLSLSYSYGAPNQERKTLGANRRRISFLSFHSLSFRLTSIFSIITIQLPLLSLVTITHLFPLILPSFYSFIFLRPPALLSFSFLFFSHTMQVVLALACQSCRAKLLWLLSTATNHTLAHTNSHTFPSAFYCAIKRMEKQQQHQHKQSFLHYQTV